MARQCSVFISSTSEDLKEYRKAASDAVLAMGLRPVAMEYFAATGGPPLGECLQKVTPSEVVIVLVAQRYGWVPPDQPGAQHKSITWLECEHAANWGKELLCFFVAEPPKWPTEEAEAYRLMEAVTAGTFTPELALEVQRNLEQIKNFRDWLEQRSTRATFTSPDELGRRVTHALHEWLKKHPECEARPAQDPRAYLEWLRDQTATIEIRGLGEGAGKARNFPIDELYIPLTTADERAEPMLAREMPAERKPMELDEALRHRRLVIVGDPGSGKTTFLRRITFEMSKDALQRGAATASGWLAKLLAAFRATPAVTPWFPIFIRIAELLGHVERCTRHPGPKGCPEPDSPEWLSHFLAALNATHEWGLDGGFFLDKLRNGEATVLLDGLDEAPDHSRREQAARLFEHATYVYSGSRFAVTTRPRSYSGRAVLSGFHEARIEPLSPEAVDTFLAKWCRGVYPESQAMADSHHQELADALRARPDIRDMTRNPVMLTALAVVHWNERRLPEQRAELYDAILKWLSRAREDKPGREKPERCLTLLAQLAFAMQNEAKGRRVRMPVGDAEAALSQQFGGGSPSERLAAAAEFLERETADSGIIVNRGGELQFWHLTFEEYLAAQAIAGLREGDQQRLLLDEKKIYLAEWREVVLLFAGILRVKQGAPKVDGLFSAVLEQTRPTLPDRARAAGLLGAIVNDLRPLDYDPSDPRYRQLMDAVLGIFDREKSQGIEFAVRLEAAEALGQAGDPRIGRNNWVRIEGGELAPFEIGRYPVTVMEYAKFIDDGGYGNHQWWVAGGFGKTNEPENWPEQRKYPNRPVVNVSWYEAAAYAAWAGVRLPSEAEWEFAARGVEGREYPWGNDEPDATRANYVEGGLGRPTPVGLYPAGATPEGILDMAGNVWEWVDDWFDNEKKLRVLRGGAWYDDARFLRAAVRFWIVPDNWGLSVGFRVAREVPVP